VTAIVKCMTKGPQGPGLVNVLFTADPRDYGATGEDSGLMVSGERSFAHLSADKQYTFTTEANRCGFVPSFA